MSSSDNENPQIYRFILAISYMTVVFLFFLLIKSNLIIKNWLMKKVLLKWEF